MPCASSARPMPRSTVHRHDAKIDPILVVPCPITGRITARNAAPGLLVQPGNPPAPYSIADISTMWMLANVTEADSPLFRVGEDVKVTVLAYPDRVFEGKITTIGATVDPNTHRLMTRSEIQDPNHELRPGMFATFVIRTGNPVSSRRGAGQWRRPRGRRHDDGMGHDRSPPLRQADGEARPAARRLRPDSRGHAAGRARSRPTAPSSSATCWREGPR